MLFGKNSQNILSAGKAKFLGKDFNSASLRNIVKTAGVTTSAFMVIFQVKNCLYKARKAFINKSFI